RELREGELADLMHFFFNLVLLTGVEPQYIRVQALHEVQIDHLHFRADDLVHFEIVIATISLLRLFQNRPWKLTQHPEPNLQHVASRMRRLHVTLLRLWAMHRIPLEQFMVVMERSFEKNAQRLSGGY